MIYLCVCVCVSDSAISSVQHIRKYILRDILSYLDCFFNFFPVLFYFPSITEMRSKSAA